jgi:pyrimidine operon attenuation protein / uracil phosphoribosyltransferase
MEKLILDSKQMALTVERLCHQIIEHNANPEQTVLIGMQPRGIYLMDRMQQYFKQHIAGNYHWGKLDITFYRDDIKKELHVPAEMQIDISLEGKNIVLIDDVLFTGRTVRAALDAVLDFGRPAKVELCVLIDRRYSREFPIQPDYTGKSIDSIFSQKVQVYWNELNGKDEVHLLH